MLAANKTQVGSLNNIMKNKFGAMKDKAGFNEPIDTREQETTERIFH
jgi:hypothetical protein